jgi:maltooligosyltrehalose trehalohydrolase
MIAPNLAYRFGPQRSGETTRFRIWAPDAEVALEIEGHAPVSMHAAGDGWQEASAAAGPGTRYRFRIGDVTAPDPASRMQSTDVHDWSVTVDPEAYSWRSEGWRGRPWEETILYELHPGLMGGFPGITEKLPRLAELGITAIELMPIGDFPGARNWGYDGTLAFAPDRSYGTPDELKSLIDAAHCLGLMVFLDVVYNHFGPDGNFLPLYAKRFFRNDVKTPWGEAIDFRQPAVRRFFIENTLYWVHEFRIDGLRFDAVHAIVGSDFLVELAAELRASIAPDRHLHLVLENDKNEAALLQAGFDAQWNDDIHHVLHALLTGESEGYYADYTERPAQGLARALAQGFIYQGEASAYRGGEKRGTRATHLPPTAFVAFLQNHDQTGNRALGERLTTLADPAALRAAIALVLLSPQIPLLFMGEEAGAEEPFLYFTDHRDAKLAEAVREGRRGEFAKFAGFADEKKRAAISDPNAAESFERSRPRFDGPGSDDWRSLYRRLLRLRREHVIPRLKHSKAEGAEAVADAAVVARWRLGDGARLTLACNLGAAAAPALLPASPPLWGEATGRLPPKTTLLWIEAP